ncbi:hypothetical protein YC2023_075984 [Brassica napus]
MQCGFLSRYVFGVTHIFSAGMDLQEQGVYFVQGRVRLNRWRCQIEIDSGWKHVCFGFSAWDSIVVCFGFLGHMRGKQMGLHGITVAEVEQRFFASKVFLASCAKRRDLLATSAVQSDVQGKVGEIMMRDLQGMHRYLQEREDSRKLQQEGCAGGRVRDQQCWRLI